jgi:hypothetical protein
MDDGMLAYVVYDVRGRVTQFTYVEAAAPSNGKVSRTLTVDYTYSPDGRVMSRTGTVKREGGSAVAIGRDEIDEWLDNYESGVTPAGPAVSSQQLIKSLLATTEPGLEPICLECGLFGPIIRWGIVVIGEIASQCKPTQVTVDELIASATKPHNGTGLSKLSRAWDKHSGREAEYYPPLKGNTEQKNATTEAWLRELLENPTTIREELGGGGVDFRTPSGTGARYNRDGSFSGVLNPRQP